MNHLIISLVLAIGGLQVASCSKDSWNNVEPSVAGNEGTSRTRESSSTRVSSFCVLPTAMQVPSATTFHVMVGASGDLRFDPESVTANIGDIIKFDFLARNHTLTQSSLSHPCQNEGGFSTGFNQFNPKNESGRFILPYRVRTLEHQWFICAQSKPKSHCQAGMLFAINAGDKFKDFVSGAKVEPTVLSQTTDQINSKDPASTSTSLDTPSPTPASSTQLLTSRTENSSVQTPNPPLASTSVSMAAKENWKELAFGVTLIAVLVALL